MELIYFLHGFFVGAFHIVNEIFQICFIYGEIAADKKQFITEIDPVEVAEELERRIDE